MLKRSAARFISIVGHPFVLIPLSIAIATAGESAGARAVVLGSVAVGFLVLAIFVVRRMRRGEFSNVDISTRTQRPAAYRLAIASLAVTALVLHLAHQNPIAVRGVASAACLLLVCSFVNRRIKASLHCAFAMFAAGVVWPASTTLGVLFVIGALVIGWARIAYERHTPREVAVGSVLGAIAAGIYVVVL